MADRPRWMDDETEALERLAFDFFSKEPAPNEAKYGQPQHVDRDLWTKAGALGLLCASIPQEYGGAGCTFAHDAAFAVGQGGERGTNPFDLDRWPELRETLGIGFKASSRDERAAVFADSDACVWPVLTPWEAHAHPHNAAPTALLEIEGLRQPVPAPRFTRTPADRPVGPRDAEGLLAQWMQHGEDGAHHE